MIAPLARTDHIVGNHGLCERDAQLGLVVKEHRGRLLGSGCHKEQQKPSVLRRHNGRAEMAETSAEREWPFPS